MPTVHKEMCTGCQRPIEDRFLLKIMDNSWHEHCVQCSICQMPLTGSCYARNRKFYCRIDYEKMFRVTCNGCGMYISPNELVMRAMGFVYHLQCFICIECGQQLQKGDHYVIRDGQLFCRMDFEKEFHMMPLSPKSFSLNYFSGEDSDSDADEDGGKHPKRPRTILTTSQRRKFKNAFELNPKPCRKVREQLAAETGLSVRVVQVWFQNQRAKVKKLARRQSQDNNGKTSNNKNKNNDKKDGNKSSDSKSDSKDEDTDQECTTRLEEEAMEINHHGNAEHISPLPASEYQASPYNGMEMPGSAKHTTMEECLDHMFSSESTSHTTMDSSGVLNPIDRLYSMQNSYFME